MAYFHSNGARLYYETHGSGPAVLLITGFAAEGRRWKAQVNALLPHYQVITLDNRGVGQSDAPLGPYTTTSMAEDCVHLLNHLHIDRAHVCGYSLGGRIAQMIAVHYPDTVDRLILASTGMTSYPVAHFVLQNYIQMLKQKLPDYYHIRALLPWFYSAELFSNLTKVERLCQLLHKQRPLNTDGLQGQLDAVTTHAPGEHLRHIKQPTLITSAPQDLLCPVAYSDALLAYIPHAKRYIMPRGSHGSIQEYPNDFNACLLPFLQGCL